MNAKATLNDTFYLQKHALLCNSRGLFKNSILHYCNDDLGETLMDNDLLIRENVVAELIALCSLIETEPDLNTKRDQLSNLARSLERILILEA